MSEWDSAPKALRQAALRALGLADSASETAIRRAYRRIARQCHLWMADQDWSIEMADTAAELDELLEERRRELARPMRGAVRDQLRRQFDRAEARLRARIAAVRDGIDR